MGLIKKFNNLFKESEHENQKFLFVASLSAFKKLNPAWMYIAKREIDEIYYTEFERKYIYAPIEDLIKPSKS